MCTLRKCWTRWILLGILLPMQPHAFGGLVRSVQQRDGDASSSELSVEVSWEFSESPSSCLIINEYQPSGWRLLDATCSTGTLHIKEGEGRIRFVVGVGQALPVAGSVTYRLIHESADSPQIVSFEGHVKTTQGLRQISVPVGGVGQFSLSLPPYDSGLRITEVQLPGASPEVGLRMTFSTSQSDGESGAFVTEDTESQGVTVHVEYRQNMNNNTPWKCISTSTLGELKAVDNEIVLPSDYRYGFYRLTLE